MEKAFDKFFDVSAMTDEAAAALMAQNGISIAVDLGGYTQHARPGILARRPAALTVNFLGFPGTFGAPYVDYILADACVIPEANKSFFSENVVWLPDTYQPPDATRILAAEFPSRAEAGLPETGFVFCCFNNTFKISPALFDVWMRLLLANEGSVLWLFANNEFARANLKREAEARGVAAERLIFAGHVAHEAHLARLTLADLFLDTLPYNAHTTASDALWAGVPVLTCRGDAFPARVAASLVAAANLPELITHSLSDYEELANTLARDSERLASLKRRLSESRNAAPLFDGERYRRHVEAAFLTMQERALRGLAPESFAVAPV
jgi:predicted O-linked N-acetylglucosamine transferase (SPINDLY family)